MAWIQQGHQFFNPDTGQYYVPQIMGGSGQGQAFGVGGDTGTIASPTGNLTAAPTGFDYWSAQGRSSPNTGFAPGTTPTQGDQPGMPTGQGWLSSTPFQSTSYDQRDKGAFGIAGMPGLAIAAPFAGAAAAGAGAFGDLSNFNLFDPSSWTSLGPNFNVPGMNQLASADTGTMTDITAGTTGDLTGGVSSLPPVASGMPGADINWGTQYGLTPADIGQGVGGGGTTTGGFSLSGIPLSTIGSTVAPVLGSAISGIGANKAASQQAAAGQKAIDTLQGQFAVNQQNLAPYIGAGTQGLYKLADYLGVNVPGGMAPSATTGVGTKPFSFDISQDPGYQFRLQQGEQAITNRASATGGVGGGGDLSGATLKELLRYGQDYASGEYQNAFNRDLATKGQTYGELAGLAGMGQGATSTGITAGTNIAGNIANTIQGIGNVQAAGTAGTTNAIGSGISQAGSNLNQALLLKQIMNPGVSSVNQGVNF